MSFLRTSASWAIVGVFVIALFFLFRGGSDGAVVVGAVLPLSGDASGRGEASRVGFEMALEDFGTSSVSVLYGDSQLSPEHGAQEARRLLEEGADVLYSSFSIVTAEISPLSIESKTPLLYDSCNCGFAQENPYAFQLYFDPRLECRRIAEHYRALGAEKGGFIATDVPYAKYCFAAMEEVLGEGNVLIELEADDGFRSYADLVSWFSAQGAEFLVSVPAVRDFGGLFEANQQKENLPILCFVEACLTADIVGQTSPGALAQTTAFALPVEDAFAQRVLVAHPDFSNEEVLSAARAYDVVAYVRAAHKRCGGPSSACLTDALSKVALDSPAVEASGFGADRVLDYEPAYIRIKEGALVPASL